MPSIEQYSEVVRLAGDLRRALAKIHSGQYHPVESKYSPSDHGAPSVLRIAEQRTHNA